MNKKGSKEVEKAVIYLSDKLRFEEYFTLEEISKETGLIRANLQRALVVLQKEGWGFKKSNFTAYRRKHSQGPVVTGRKKRSEK